MYDVLLVYVLIAGAFFRLSGIFWGEYQYLHPDERFLVWVGSDISPVKSLSEYFDTANSTLNPHNVGHGFYVYGTLPMFITRYVVQWIFGHSGFDVMTQVGRSLSVLADLLTVFLVYLIAARLYDKRVGLLAAAFSAATVLHIQQSHFFTMDTFLVAFAFLAFYFAVRALTATGSHQDSDDDKKSDPSPGSSNQNELDPSAKESTVTSRAQAFARQFVRDPLFLPSLGFGVALGMAVASKLDAVPLAATLPLAMLIGLFQMPPEDRGDRAIRAFLYLCMAALVSLLVFRIFQPYTFSGPGFFGLKPNPNWLANIKELVNQSSGDVDFPPNMQWARRPVWFSGKNLVIWGLGLPLGILAWAGFLWAGGRILTRWKVGGEWGHHALIWVWTGVYFTWQSLRLNPTMRYQMLIYPALAIFAAWAIVALWDKTKITKSGEGAKQSQQRISETHPKSKQRRSFPWLRLGVVLFAGLVLSATFAYAFAFSRLYTRPITRIEASRWIYQNIPGPINLAIQSSDGIYNQPIPFPYNLTIAPGVPYNFTFKPKVAGSLSEIYMPHLVDRVGDNQVRSLHLSISLPEDPLNPLGEAILVDSMTPDSGEAGKGYTLTLDRVVTLDPERDYTLRFDLPGEEIALAIDDQVTLRIIPSASDTIQEPLDHTLENSPGIIRPNSPFIASFTAPFDGYIVELIVGGLSDQNGNITAEGLSVSLLFSREVTEPLTSSLTMEENPTGQGYLLVLDQPLPVFVGETPTMRLELFSKDGAISLSGMNVANEGDWDDGLPLRLDGYDGFAGIYPRDLNFNMYWDDNEEKLSRFVRIMDQTDYILISSSRQWGSLPRIPERFPMTTIYYRELLGCPDDMDIEYCYNVARPGTFIGNLGFELVQTFQQDVVLGPIRINDQFAEEAFTVYDHPKVFIFKKRADFNLERLRSVLGVVDFSQVIRKPPMRYAPHPEDLTLPDHRFAEQRQGGTWSQLFDTFAAQNRYQVLGVLAWYLCLGMLGLVAFPILRYALPGLSDGGYPLARTAGMLILSYLVWMAGSLRVPFSRLTITIIFGLLLLFSIYLTYRQRKEMRQLWRERWGYFLMVESLTLAFFLAFLLVRLGNPDLWHPWKGGEKPMDFSYFNAVLKSTSFPPFDPWYAGGYLNYYYYGFVFSGVLVKWLGIVPSIAYNLILPTLFALIAMGAFSVVWNLLARRNDARNNTREQPTRNRLSISGLQSTPLIPAFAASLGMAVLGNLGTVKMIFQGFQKLAAPDGVIEGANLWTKWGWALNGLRLKLLQGANFPYSIGDWYWNPSRAIPAPGEVEPITEFPYFTALYADPHAHLFALPIALLGLGAILGIVLGRGRWRTWLGAALGFLVAGLAVGALRPTNTWDFYPYLALGVFGIGYALWTNFKTSTETIDKLPILNEIPSSGKRILATLGGMGLFAGLAFLLFQPYANWYALGYSEIEIWKGTHTPVSAYLTHWGLFLFLIVSWMVKETLDWMAKTPLSALRKLERFKAIIWIGLLILLVVVAILIFYLNVRVAWLVLPLAAWAGVLLLRPTMPDAKRAVLFIVGTGLVLTLMVEVIVLRGDIGRMNTVFKFYLQVWTLFAVSAGASLGWLLPGLPVWSPRLRGVWQAALVILVAGASLFTVMATLAKVKDRIADEAPHTLDGMAYMPYATYRDTWGEMQLSQDYEAIRWMQENVIGSPVIVEANLRNLYRWGSRFSIYTGLPGVVGWEWHQQQQRAVLPGSRVSQRIAEIDDFYLTTEWKAAQDFLHKYQVRYIIVGQQERGLYPGLGLEKFDQAEGILWLKVYQKGETAIYEVIQEPLIAP